ncbi:MAG: ROK family protein [Ignavibacteriales bacterium]|nr:ROK family protein [Ignavibacteriales bacterium]
MKILGIDLGGTNLRVGLVENDKLVRIECKQINSDGTQEEILIDIFSLIEKFPLDEIIGLGIGVPGVVDLKKGIVYEVQNIPSWNEVKLKEYLEEKYHIPVYINNDANCFAAGEKYFGKAKEYKNIVGLILGTGLGAGLILNGKLYSGANCGAGEFGMISYKESILEHYCSGQFFSKFHSKAGGELFQLAKEGNEKALEIFSEFGFHLGEALKLILYSIDPELIILGGSVSKSFKFFKETMWKSIGDFAYSQVKENIKIEVSEVDNIAILGAASLYLDARTL